MWKLFWKDYPANVDYPPLSQQLFNPCFDCLNSYPPKVGIIRYHSTPKGTKILPRHREDIKTCSSARPGFAMELSLFRYTWEPSNPAVCILKMSRMHFNTLDWVVHQLGISTKTGDSNILISPSWMIQPFETLGLASPRLWSSPPVSMTLRHQGDARVMPLAIPVPISLTLTHMRQWT